VYDFHRNDAQLSKTFEKVFEKPPQAEGRLYGFLLASSALLRLVMQTGRPVREQFL
jgi:hypothetical protein